MEHRLYYRKISCIIGRPIVVLEDQLYYWKSTFIRRSIAMLEDEWKIKGIFRKSAVLKTINWIRWKLPIKENNCKYSEQNAVHLASPDTHIECAIQMSVTPF